MGINKENSGVYVEGNVELKKVFEEGIHPLGEKIEIKDGGEIITQSEGNLTTPKVLNVNIMKEKKLTLNTIGLDKTKLEYNIEEKEGNLDFDVNIMTGEIRLKVKSGINAGIIFSIKDRGTNKVYPISLVIKAVDRKK